MRLLFFFILFLFLLTPPDAALAQRTEGEEESEILLSFPNIPLPVILGELEQLTGKRIVKDNSIIDTTLSVETQQKLTPKEAAEFIEKSLLLNGIALVPSGKDTLKAVSISGSSQPSSEGVPIFTLREQLPEKDEIVTYLAALKHLPAQQAVDQLLEIFTLHSYGKIVALDASSALAITENANTIHKILDVLDRLDIPPREICHRLVELKRGDPETVVAAVIALLGLDTSTGENAEGTAVASNSTINPTSTEATFVMGLSSKRSVRPRIQAIPRSGKIILVGQIEDVDYIEAIIQAYDEPAAPKNTFKRKLNYMPVATFLGIAEHALAGGQAVAAQTSETAGGDSVEQASVSLGSLNSGSAASSSDEVQDIGPQSIVVGKTVLIADNVHNTLHMSGPEEDILVINNLLDSMDIKPRQILISAVIAQMTLDKDFQYGVDFFRTLDRPDPTGVAGVSRNRTGSILDPGTLTDFNSLLPAASGLTVYGNLTDTFDGILSTNESQNRFKVLSRPTVYTLNNRRAEILSGQRIAVPRSQQSVLAPNDVNTNQVVTSSIDFEDVLLRIEVIPLINADDRVTLQIAQTNEDIVGNQIIGGDQIPTIGTQALRTTVIIPDGGTVLLGGLISEEDNKSKSGTPGFINLPLFGDVFGNTDITKERQELMVFIQPRIIDDHEDHIETDIEWSERAHFYHEATKFSQTSIQATPVCEPTQKKGLLKRIFKLDKMDETLTSPSLPRHRR